MTDLIPNIMNPILALALVMPFLTTNKLMQYSTPIMIYCLLNGVYASQIGLYVTLFIATWCADNMQLLKAFCITLLSFHILNLYAMVLHPDSTYTGALVADINLATGTALYLVLFALMRKGWQKVLSEV